jgi:hypothetical protein
MDAAIQAAIAKLKASCPSCAGDLAPDLIKLIESATFVYEPDNDACGDTGMLTFLRIRRTFVIGGASFNGLCCSLSSTIVHEAVHGLTHFDGKAYDVEEKCFGCKRPPTATSPGNRFSPYDPYPQFVLGRN